MRKGLSRRDLADLAGITEKQVGLIERGVATHSYFDTLAAIARAVDRDPVELFPPLRRVTRR